MRVTLELDEKEVRALLRLLEDHLYYGWVEAEGECGWEGARLVPSGEASPALQGLYRRVRELVKGVVKKG